MPSINDTSATKALNEDKYINKVYDNVIDKQKNLLKENYTQAGTALDAEKQSVQQQTNTNLGRVNVEAQKIQQAYKGPKLSAAAQQQAALSMDNQKKKNVTTIKTAQSEADAEIERQRKLLGEQYAAAIKKAQADNDMARAQQLYEAAKAEDEQLLALKREAGTKLAAMGDNSVLDSLLNGGTPTRDTTSETWNEVRKREGEINKVYDSAIESDRQAAQMALSEALSEIEAKQAAESAATDRNLTQTYVNALKGAKNYNEVQGAYGLGSGTLAQARLARALGMAGDLADQRGVHMGTAAKRGQQRFAAGQVYRDAIAKSVDTNENKRAQALYEAAEAEEQSLIDTQKSVGEALAQQGNYSVLAKLWGLNQDQIDRLQGTGAYAPSYGGGYGGSYYGGGGDDETYTGSSDGVDPSVMDLGYGPISKDELSRKIESGEVLAIENKDGSYKYVKIDNTPGSAAGAAIEAAVANGGKPVFVSAGQKETVMDKIGNVVSNIPIVGDVGTAIGKAIANAYIAASSSSNKSSGGGSSVHTSSSGTSHGGGGGSFGGSGVDAVTSAAPKPSASTTTSKPSSSSKDTSAYWSTQGSSNKTSGSTSSKTTSSSSNKSSSSTSSKSTSSSSSGKASSSSSSGGVVSKVVSAIKSWFK